MRKKSVHVTLISLLTISAFVALFVFRSADDNRLTSWLWIFAHVDVGKIYLILAVCVILAYLFSKAPLPERYRGLLLFSSSFLMSTMFWGEPEIIVDAARYFTQAKHLEVYGFGHSFREWGRDIPAWTDLPLVPFLYGIIFRLLGESRLYIQIFATVLFSMTVVLTYRIGKTLWNEETGLIGGALLLGIPYIFTQIPLMLVDVPTMFFLTLLIFAFTQALWNGGRRMVALSSIALFLAFFSKYSTWPMLSVLGVIFLVSRIRNHDPAARNRAFRTALIVLGTSAVMIGIVYFFRFDVFSEQVKLLIGYQKPGLRRWGESFLSTFFFQIHPFITLSALYSAWVAYEKRDSKYLIICWALVLVTVFQVKRIRYLLPVFPMIALMASYGLQQIRDGEVRKFAVFCIIFSSLGVAIFAYLPFTQKMSMVNLKEAGEFLNTIDETNIEVFTLPQKKSLMNPSVAVPILDLFTKKQIIYLYDSTNPFAQDEINRSSVRFTWEYKNPPYYVNTAPGSDTAVVVISPEAREPLPDSVAEKIKGYRMVKVFESNEGVFEYKTIVSVYRSASRAGTENGKE